jgi:hypothetical protein
MRLCKEMVEPQCGRDSAREVSAAASSALAKTNEAFLSGSVLKRPFNVSMATPVCLDSDPIHQRF